MLKPYHKLFLGVVIIMSLGLSVVSGILYKKNQQITSQTEDKTKLYTNKNFNFSVKLPVRFAVAEESQAGVSFMETKDDFLAELAISVTSSKFTSTEAWLEAQPKGSSKIEGYQQLVLASNGYSTGTAIMAEYVNEDTLDDKGDKVNLKRLDAIHVENGRVYIIKFGGTYKADQAPIIDQERFDFINSFHVLK